jgi:hypothetical protein
MQSRMVLVGAAGASAAGRVLRWSGPAAPERTAKGHDLGGGEAVFSILSFPADFGRQGTGFRRRQ